MEKRLPMILACVVASSFCRIFAQYAVMDAIALGQDVAAFTKIADVPVTSDEDKREMDRLATSIATRLRNYYTPQDGNPSASEVVEHFSKKAPNPFFGDILAKVERSAQKSRATVTASETALVPGTSLSVSAAAEGFARFLLKRAQEEAAEYLLEQCASLIHEYPEIQQLLPSSSAKLLKELESKSVTSIVATLPECFKADMRNLPGCIVGLGEMSVVENKAAEKRRDAYKAFFETPSGFSAEMLALVYEDIRAGRSALSLFSDIATAATNASAQIGQPAGPSAEQYCATLSYLRLMHLFAESFWNKEKANWIGSDLVASCFADETSRRFYFGLLYERVTMASEKVPIRLDGRSDIVSLLAANSSKVLGASDLVSSLAHGLEVTNALAESIAEAGSDTAAVKSAAARYTSAMGDFAAAVLDPALPKKLGISEESSRISSILASMHSAVVAGLDMGRALCESDYVAAFDAALAYFESIASSPDAGEAAIAIDHVIAGLSRFGEVAAAIASAEDAEDVESILSTYALGPTSYRTKFNHRFSIALNAYVGADVAWDIGGGGSYAPDNLGAYAPLGLALSWATRCAFPSSVSLFVGLLDIGAVAAYRLEDSDAQMPDLELKDLFSGSVNLVFGVSKSPFSLGFGMRLGPALRSIGSGGETVLGDNPWQIHAFAGVDIPIASLFARQ